MDVQKSKKLAAKAMRNFESRMEKSKNDLERCIILNEMRTLIQNEIDSWFVFIAQEDSGEKEVNENFLNEGAKHVVGLEEIIAKIDEFKNMFFETANKLADVLAREGNLPEGGEVFTSEFLKITQINEN